MTVQYTFLATLFTIFLLLYFYLTFILSSWFRFVHTRNKSNEKQNKLEVMNKKKNNKTYTTNRLNSERQKHTAEKMLQRAYTSSLWDMPWRMCGSAHIFALKNCLARHIIHIHTHDHFRDRERLCSIWWCVQSERHKHRLEIKFKPTKMLIKNKHIICENNTRMCARKWIKTKIEKPYLNSKIVQIKRNIHAHIKVIVWFTTY